MFENVRYCKKSDIGLKRHSNEDSLFIVDPSCNRYNLEKFGIAFVIADGIGGHAAGDIASRMACEEVIDFYYRDDILLQTQSATDEEKVWKLEQAIRSAHNKIILLTTERGELRGMGTTLSALVLTEDKAIIAHVGDSRIYRCRNNTSVRMTVDHTRSQDLIDGGQILPEDAHNSCGSHILTQAVGGYDDLEVVLTGMDDVQEGDIFLLCTDGLHDLVADSEIQGILIKNALPQTACDALVQAAIRNGGDDNISVIVIRV